MRGFCDCGAPATGKDGSGYFCEACKIAVAYAHKLIEDQIKRERRDLLTDEQRDNFDDNQSYYQRYKLAEKIRQKLNYKKKPTGDSPPSTSVPSVPEV